MKVEGNRKSVVGVMYTEPEPIQTDLSETYFTESELEALFIGTESEARKRYQSQGSYQRRDSYGRRQR